MTPLLPRFVYLVVMKRLQTILILWTSAFLPVLSVPDGDYSTLSAMPGYADLPKCAQYCLVGDPWGGEFSDSVWGDVGCDTTPCLCDHFDNALSILAGCVPRVCGSSYLADVTPATSIFYGFCSTMMGVGWVAPDVTTQRTYTSPDAQQEPTPGQGAATTMVVSSLTVTTQSVTVTSTPTGLRPTHTKADPL